MNRKGRGLLLCFLLTTATMGMTAIAAPPDFWLPAGVLTPSAHTNLDAGSAALLAARQVKVTLRVLRQLQAATTFRAGQQENANFRQELARLRAGKKPEVGLEKMVQAWDLDRDGRIDLFAVQGGYFGPSYGYIFYGRQGNRFRYLWDNSGWIAGARAVPGGFNLIFRVTIIDPAETEIFCTIDWDRRRQRAAVGPSLYLAQQTRLPASRTTPLPFTVRAVPLRLRYSPGLSTNAPAGSPHLIGAAMSATLRDNIVAEYGKGARGYVLARADGWVFVACAPVPAPLRQSLHHGMDGQVYDEKSNTIVYKPPIPPWILGWVRERELRF